MSNVYSRVYATEKCLRQLIVQGCGKQRGGDYIIRKRDFKLQYGWLYRLMREKCVLRTCHRKFSYSNDNFKSEITCIFENYIHIYWMQLTKGSKRR